MPDGLRGRRRIERSTQFRLPCRSDGKFPDAEESCTPISCNVPQVPMSTSPARDKVLFDAVVSYTCLDGYEVAAGISTFAGKCSGNGEIKFVGAAGGPTQPECEPVKCGAAPAQPDSVMLFEKPSCSDKVCMPFCAGEIADPKSTGHLKGTSDEISDPREGVCDEGYTVGDATGGRDGYSMEPRFWRILRTFWAVSTELRVLE